MKHHTTLDAQREALLSRYVDDRLDVDERADMQRWLAEHPEEQARARAWQHDNAILRAHYEPLAHAAVPERLLKVAKRASRQSPMRYAAAVAWLLAGACVGYLAAILPGSAEGEPPSLALWRDAAMAHAVYVPEVRHPVEVGAEQEAHLVAWLSKRVGTKLKVPHLQDAGFSLVGGRLLPGSNGAPVAQFMYQDTEGHRLTLYVRRDATEAEKTAFRFGQEGRVSVFYWIDDGFGFALSGELERDSLLRISQSVYQQLNP